MVDTSNFDVTTDLAQIDLDLVHAWLSRDAYWSLGRTRATVETAAQNSINFGARDTQGTLRGYARVVTDQATFAWVCDVYVDPAARGLGIGQRLVEAIVKQLEPMQLKRVVLATLDAHGVYEKAGFVPLPEPHKWMVLETMQTTLS